MRRTTFRALAIFAVLALGACGGPPPPAPTAAPSPAVPSPAVPTSTGLPAATPTAASAPLRVVGYYGAWGAERGAFLSRVKAGQLTHLNYAFSNVSEQGECVLGDPAADVERAFTAAESVSGVADSTAAGALRGNFHQLQELKQKAPQLQVLISIGGWTWSSQFSKLALTEAGRQAFARSCIDLYLKGFPGAFDGLDIDWEFPVSGGLTPGRLEDTRNFTLLLAELRRQLDALGAADGRHYLLTIAAPAPPSTAQNLELGEIVQYLDWVNLMAYDFHGTWEAATNFNAPLYKAFTDPNPGSDLTGDGAVQRYVKAGVPPERLVLGVPFYGHGWQGVANAHDGLFQIGQGAAPGSWGEAGAFEYRELKEKYLPTYARFWNDEARVPWLYNPFTGIFISYDDAESLSAKAAYVGEHGLGGVMIWELSQDDDEGALLDALYTRLHASPPALAPTPTPYSVAGGDPPGTGVFFDDFSYAGPDDARLRANAWSVRVEAVEAGSGPSLPGAAWSAAGAAFLPDPANAQNRLVQLSASTDGTVSHTLQSDFYQLRKFYEGTYASRVRFVDAPGAGGDAVVEAFLAVTPLKTAYDPDYGEIDFAYLPNGDADHAGPVLALNTWETVLKRSPWTPAQASEVVAGSQDGWHTLVVQVAGGEVKYYVDGTLQTTHGGVYYPETPLAIHYGVWLLDGGLAPAGEPRRYVEQVDWLYYAGNAALSQAEVEAEVAAYRAAGKTFEDRVPAWIPVVAVPTATPAPVHVPGSPRPFEKEIHAVSGVQIDGKLDDWPDAPTFTFDDKSQIVYSREPDNWGGPSDLSALAWAGWTSDGLYFAFKVTDDALVQAWSGAAIWQGDYVELQIDTQLEQDYDETAMNGDDYQIGVTPGDFAQVSPQAAVWFGPDPDGHVKDIQQAQVKTSDGYILEVFIPKELLQGITLSEGATLGMNVNPSDCDLAGLPQKLMMSTSPIRTLTDPTTWGKIVLVR